MMFEPIARKFVDWSRRRHAIRRLRVLDDRLLADMGVRRAEIDAFVAGDRT